MTHFEWQALNDFSTALECAADPSHKLLIVKQMGLVHLRLHEYSKAVDQLHQALQMQSCTGELDTVLETGYVVLYLSQSSIAKRSQIWVCLGGRYALALRGEGRMSEAMEGLRLAIKQLPRELNLRMCYGVICYERGHDLLKGMLSRVQGTAVSICCAADGWEDTAQDLIATGRRSFQAVVHIDPSLASARINLAYSCQAEGVHAVDFNKD